MLGIYSRADQEKCLLNSKYSQNVNLFTFNQIFKVMVEISLFHKNSKRCNRVTVPIAIIYSLPEGGAIFYVVSQEMNFCRKPSLEKEIFMYAVLNTTCSIALHHQPCGQNH